MIFLFASFLFIAFLDPEKFWMSALLNHNAYHNSAFIMSLICIHLYFKYLNTKSRKALIAILALSMLSGACDKLFFIYFTIPVALTAIVLYFFNKDWKTSTKFLVVLAIGTILAIALWIFFQNNPYFKLIKPYGEISAKFIQNSWSVFSQQMHGYLTEFSFLLVLSYLSILSYLAAITYISIKTYQRIKKKKPTDIIFALELFVLFFTPIVLFAPILSGSYDNLASLRYSYYPYILLPFNLVILASNWLNKNKLFKIALNTTFSLLIVGYLLIHYPVQNIGKGLKYFFNFYPEKAKIIDDYFPDDGTLKYGITNEYWTAKHATMFSKKGVRLYFAWDWGEPWLHATNKHWFIDHDKGKHAHCQFTFLLWEKEKEIPNIFKTLNDSTAIHLGNWNLYGVKPYRFIMPGKYFGVEPVLIDSSEFFIKTNK
jgi:hypothetical protein